jgi:hypothetical protein
MSVLAAPPPLGYWLLGGDGGVFSFNAPFFGSAASVPTKCAPNTVDRSLPDGTCFAMAATPDGRGYWILNGDTARFFGSAGGIRLARPVFGIVARRLAIG